MRDDQPSATANIVARNILLTANTKKLSRFVTPTSARLSALLVQSHSPDGEKFIRRSRRTLFQTLFRFYERITIPGLALHQALRKLHIERGVRDGLEEGFEQVVVLGGGLDTLAMRLHSQFPQVNFLELDHPATQAVKLAVINEHHLGSENLTLLPVDFTRQSLKDCLAACATYQTGAKTIFLCEGVLMYLDASEVDALFAFIRQESGGGVRFIFTFMEPDENGETNFRNSTRLVQLWLHLRKEPFKWGLLKDDMKEFLQARGFSMRELATPETLRYLYLSPHGLQATVLAEGENICVCDA
jgi:methyltransferase (TIGR00027 family)